LQNPNSKTLVSSKIWWWLAPHLHPKDIPKNFPCRLTSLTILTKEELSDCRSAMKCKCIALRSVHDVQMDCWIGVMHGGVALCSLGSFCPLCFCSWCLVFLLKFSQSLNVFFLHKVKNSARFCVSYSLRWWRGEGGAAMRNDSSWSPCWQANNRRISAIPLVPYVRHLETAQSLVSLHSRVMWNLL